MRAESVVMVSATPYHDMRLLTSACLIL